MIMVTGRFSIDPTKRAAFIVFAKGMVSREQQQPGCLGFGIFEDVTRMNTFIMIEQWESAEALDAHSESAIFAHDDEVMSTFLIAEPSWDEYEFE